jgi:lipopolysaccharide/colanic/teichoic acid biosynthesis glycosyltransferase
MLPSKSAEKLCVGRLAALPGITGYWQIKGRGPSTLAERIAMDLD